MEQEDKNAAAMVANVAAKIIELAEDGTKLITVHKHYPDKGRAISVGFHMMLGACFGGCTFYALARIVEYVIKFAGGASE